MAFVTDAFGVWLVEQLADAGRRGLVRFVRGDAQDDALRRAADRAIRLTASDFLDEAEPLAEAIDQVFGDPSGAVSGDFPTVLQSLKAGVTGRLAVLGDREMTGIGTSSADLLGVSVAAVTERLVSHLIAEIGRRGSHGGPLQPLAAQLNSDISHEQIGLVSLTLTDLDVKVDTILRGMKPDQQFLSDRQLIIAQERRHEANAWCDKVLGGYSVDFWETDWRERLHAVIDTAQSLALTARGGSGKSVLAAHLVRHFLRQDPYCCPIVLHRPDDLRGGAGAVRELAGAESAGDLSRYVSAMRSVGHRVLFVLDGLDSLIGAESTKSVAVIVQELANLSCLLVTCRTELWERAFRHLSIDQQTVEPLSEKVVRQVLLQHTRLQSRQLDVLRLPFYLDAALLMNADYSELPETEAGMLHRLLKLYGAPPSTAMPRWESFEPLLVHLAELQLASSDYEIRRETLLGAASGMRDAAGAVAHLESTGVLWRQIAAGQSTVRLNHDLLDCFNMARLLLPHDQARQARMLVYERAADLAGWTVLSMLVQISHDLADDLLVREVFGELLRMLDLKKFGAECMGRAWAATYVLRDKITILMPLVLECLDGRQAKSLEDAAGPGGSCLGPKAAVTQEAASSLASAFDGLRDWRAGMPEQAIPVLSRGLHRWEFRKRFVEALARYRDPAAAKALINFAQSQLAEGGDTELLGEMAEALGRMGSGLGSEGRRACVEMLSEMIISPFLDARARREAIKANNELTGLTVDVVPEIAEAEIVTYLDPLDHAHGTYSDWRVVKRYADHAYKRIMKGHLSQPLLAALLQAFTHEQLFVRTAVADCLGQADDPVARATLVAELLRPALPWDVQQACIHALDTQVREAKPPIGRALRRWLILNASAEATCLQVPAAAALAKAAARPQGSGEPIVTDGAFEIVPVATETQIPSVAILSPEAAPIAEWIRDLASPDDYAEVGAGREAKYRAASIQREENGQLVIAVARTTWEEGASFHRAMSRQAPLLRENADRILSAWLSGANSFPGILCAHCIVLTGDHKIVNARRGQGTVYAGGRWSTSFEEQLTSIDFESQGQDPVTAAALRGYEEEFGLSSYGCRASVVSAVVEFPITNLAMLVVVETDESSEAIQHAVSAADRADGEIAEVAFIGMSREHILATMQRSDLHPTSEIRLRVLARRYGM